jgi:ribonuclease R
MKKRKRSSTSASPKKSPSEVFLIGILRTNPKGFGFVVASDIKAFPEDTFVARHLLNGAIDGDLVEVKRLPLTDKGPEGIITSILERGRSRLAGIVSEKTNDSLILYSPLLGPNKPIVIANPDPSLQYGDRVIVKIVDWGEKNIPISGEIESQFGSIDDASLDIQAAAEEFQIAKTFPEEVLKQAQSFGKRVFSSHLKNRLDLTKTTCFTIDPKTAKDFDDALSLFLDEEGNYHLGVHIADVAHYVKPGTPLDIEAEKRANSTYFPGTCLPMLPEELSNNLCSLKPKVLRLCISVLAKLSAQGDVLHVDIQRSYIKSAKRFSYEEAKDVLDGKKKSPHKPTLELMVDLCKLLKKKRNERGSIDFALPETVLCLDSEGEPISYEVVEYDITHQLVEEFMLKANELVAQALKDKGHNLIFRVHEEPAEQNKEEFFALARLLGFFLPPEPTTQDIQKLFEKAKNSPYSQQLSVGFIRSMKLAIYSPDNVGHFGLALENYCHFTSPIRRYPDLIIQRLLCNELPVDVDLHAIATHCSNRERISFKAEQSVKTLKKLRLLNRWFTKDPERVYQCQVTKVKPYSLYFELPNIAVEGSLHISEIHGDYFVYDAVKGSFIGKRTGMKFAVGDFLNVRLEAIDLIFLETRWARVQKPPCKKPKH